MLACIRRKASMSGSSSLREERGVARGREEFKRVSGGSTLFRMLKMTAPYWPYLVLGLLSAAAAGVCFPIYGYLLGESSYYLVTSSGDTMVHNIKKFSLWSLGVMLVLMVSYFLLNFSLSHLTARLTRDMRALAFCKVIHYDAEFFDIKENNANSLAQNLSRDAELVDAAGGTLLAVVLLMLVSVITGTAISICWHAVFGLVMLCVLPFQWLTVLRGYMLHMTGTTHPDRQAAQQMALDTVIIIKTVKAYGTETALSDKHDQLMYQSYQDSNLETHYNGLLFGLSTLVTNYTYTLAFWFGGWLAKEGHASTEEYITITYIIVVSIFGILVASVFTASLPLGTDAAKRLFALIDYQPKIHSLQTGAKTEVQGPIRFQEVHFRYARRANPVLKGISFTVQSRQRVGITGAIGSGKTTIIQLLLRFYDVSQGSILINGVDIRAIDIKHLRRHIVTVGQEPVLFSGTLRHNIAFGLKTESGEDVSDAAILQAMKSASVNFTDDLGLDVGVRGLSSVEDRSRESR